MGVPIVYPASLPGPSSAGLQAVERRMLTPVPFEARNVERDRRKLQHIELPPFTDDEASAFRDWYDDVLELGGAWFAAPWPFPAALVGFGFATAVRRWVAAPSWKKDDAGFWHVSGDCEVRGVGMLPVRRPELLLGMHFDGGFTDETGHGVTDFEDQPGNVSATYPTTDPKFGSANYLGTTFSRVLISDDRGALALNSIGRWRVGFWCKPQPSPSLPYNGGGVLHLIHGGVGNSNFDGGPKTQQVKISLKRLGIDTTKAYLVVQYLNAVAGVGGIPADYLLAPIGDDAENSAIPCGDDVWHYVDVGGDETSTRAYIDGVLAMDDHNTLLGVATGTRPLMVPAAPIGMHFIVGALFDGFQQESFVDPADWLNGINGGTDYQLILNRHWVGELDDLVVVRGEGPSDLVPSAAFAGS